jgi:hypothetical protein
MERYRNTGGDSGVDCYEIGADYIDIKFNGTSRSYRYSSGVAGSSNVEIIKRLARSGPGLNSFINLNVKFKYDR